MTTDPARVAAARRWFRALGCDPVVTDGVTVVADPNHADTWDANFASAAPDAQVSAILTAIDRGLGHAPWQTFYADALTMPEQEAGLVFAGFAAQGPVIEMLAGGAITPRHPPARIAVRQVESRSDRTAFEDLVTIDHGEGKRTGGVHDAAVQAGLLAGMHARGAHHPYSLIVVDGEPVGYGLAIPCPNGLGVIEHLFTRPDRRGHGFMTAFIVDAADRLRAQGCNGVFLDAHPDDTPRFLYAALGFAPVTCARYLVRHQPSA